jgi:hypothetical protein
MDEIPVSHDGTCLVDRAGRRYVMKSDLNDVSGSQKIYKCTTSNTEYALVGKNGESRLIPLKDKSTRRWFLDGV